jgi:hypothetical protein
MCFFCPLGVFILFSSGQNKIMIIRAFVTKLFSQSNIFLFGLLVIMFAVIKKIRSRVEYVLYLLNVTVQMFLERVVKIELETCIMAALGVSVCL